MPLSMLTIIAKRFIRDYEILSSLYGLMEHNIYLLKDAVLENDEVGVNQGIVLRKGYEAEINRILEQVAEHKEYVTKITNQDFTIQAFTSVLTEQEFSSLMHTYNQVELSKRTIAGMDLEVYLTQEQRGKFKEEQKKLVRKINSASDKYKQFIKYKDE